MPEDKSEILKKTLGHHSIEFQSGRLSIWNIPSMIFTLNTYLLLEKVALQKFGKDFQDMIYYLGKQQARAGTEILQKQFGYKDMRKAVTLELQTSAMIGMGVCTVIRYKDSDKIAIVKIDPNPYADVCKKIVGLVKEPIDNFSRGAIAGIFSYAFGGDMVAIETQCSAMGKPYCLIEAKPRDKWDMKNKLVASQMPKHEGEYQDLITKITAKGMRTL